MALNTVTTGNTILASDINQLVFVLQRQSGQTETGQYFIEAGTNNGTGWTVGQWIPSLSRNSTPVSVTVDSALVSPVSLGSPATQQLNANGFFVGAGSSGGSSNTARVGGNYTIQY